MLLFDNLKISFYQFFYHHVINLIQNFTSFVFLFFSSWLFTRYIPALLNIKNKFFIITIKIIYDKYNY